VCGANDLPTTIAAGPNLDEQKVYVEVNRIRRARGLRPLAWNERLRLAAAEHSHEQYRHGYMGHGSPDPNRRTLIQRIRLTGYDGRCFGEVVAWGYKTPEAVVEGWMNSPDHRAILVDRDLSEVGFSRVGDYWTGNFGAPRTPRPVATYAPVRRPPVAAAPAPRRRPEPSYAYAAPAPTSAPAPPVRSYFQPPRPTPTPAPARRVPARSG
jgi:hypothetical protein